MMIQSTTLATIYICRQRKTLLAPTCQEDKKMLTDLAGDSDGCAELGIL